MAKTADYTIKAIANYQKTKERITILFDKGTKDALIKKHGARPVSTIIKEIIDADLNNDEKPTEPRPETTTKKAPKKSAPDQPTIKADNPADDPANDPALIFENFKS